MLRRINKGERGFTLVELLVTIAILGTLFGIVTLALNGLANNSTANIKAAELSQVQTAVDIYLAANYPGTTAITADTDAAFKSYLRSLPTQYSYSWDTAGNVTQP
jgi:type IV pilus assembly protein PilA